LNIQERRPRAGGRRSHDFRFPFRLASHEATEIGGTD